MRKMPVEQMEGTVEEEEEEEAASRQTGRQK